MLELVGFILTMFWKMEIIFCKWAWIKKTAVWGVGFPFIFSRKLAVAGSRTNGLLGEEAKLTKRGAWFHEVQINARHLWKEKFSVTVCLFCASFL